MIYIRCIITCSSSFKLIHYLSLILYHLSFDADTFVKKYFAATFIFKYI